MRFSGFLSNFQETLISGTLNMFSNVDYTLPTLIFSVYISMYSPLEMLAATSYVSTLYQISIFSVLFGLMDSVGVYTAQLLADKNLRRVNLILR